MCYKYQFYDRRRTLICIFMHDARHSICIHCPLNKYFWECESIISYIIFIQEHTACITIFIIKIVLILPSNFSDITNWKQIWLKWHGKLLGKICNQQSWVQEDNLDPDLAWVEWVWLKWYEFYIFDIFHTLRI